MDAKVGDWVVTPRRGKAVEINALSTTPSSLLAGWLLELDGASAAAPYTAAAERARGSFNARFWNEAAGHLYDVVDGENGDDAACRPNQLVASRSRTPSFTVRSGHAVLTVCEERLLTPFGLRSLSVDHPDYKPRLLRRSPRSRRGVSSGTVVGVARRPLRGRFPADATR